MIHFSLGNWMSETPATNFVIRMFSGYTRFQKNVGCRRMQTNNKDGLIIINLSEARN